MTKYLAVAIGGALGSALRFWIGNLIGTRAHSRLPLGTMAINVTGSFIIGFFLTLVTERLSINPNWRLAIAVGFVGGYTTFSTFEYETFRLVETGSGVWAVTNVLLSLFLGFLAVWGGAITARRIGSRPITAKRAPARAASLAQLSGQASGARELFPDHRVAENARDEGKDQPQG